MDRPRPSSRVRVQRRPHVRGGHGQAVLLDQGGDGQTVGLGDFTPAFAELAALDHEHLLARGEEVGHGRVHGSRARTGQRQNLLPGAEKILKAGLDALHDPHEILLAVMDHVLGQGQADLFRQGSGSGSEQSKFVEHSLFRKWLLMRLAPVRACAPVHGQGHGKAVHGGHDPGHGPSHVAGGGLGGFEQKFVVDLQDQARA